MVGKDYSLGRDLNMNTEKKTILTNKIGEAQENNFQHLSSLGILLKKDVYHALFKTIKFCRYMYSTIHKNYLAS
jgi:hypothetical protein